MIDHTIMMIDHMIMIDHDRSGALSAFYCALPSLPRLRSDLVGGSRPRSVGSDEKSMRILSTEPPPPRGWRQMRRGAATDCSSPDSEPSLSQTRRNLGWQYNGRQYAPSCGQNELENSKLSGKPNGLCAFYLPGGLAQNEKKHSPGMRVRKVRM